MNSYPCIDGQQLLVGNDWDTVALKLASFQLKSR
jgi:hypothetical protein